MKIILSLVKIIPADESHREFSYYVLKAAHGEYITRIWGWNDIIERDFHSKDWKNCRPLLILYNTKPIGTISLDKTKGCLEIGMFYILPEYMNKGIGSYLLEKILNDNENTSLIAKLTVLKINPAISLYQRHGFEIVKEDEIFYYMECKPKYKYQAIIFDLFGTLVDNFTVTEYQRVLAEMSSVLKVPPEGFSRLWRDTFRLRTNGTHRTHQESIRYICRELSVAVTEERIEKAAAIRLDFTIRTLKPRREAVPVIKKLKSLGYKVGLISDCSPETPTAWPKTPFDGLFDVTVFSCVVGVKKPDPRIYRIATDSLKVKPQDCLYIGDGSSQELTGARQAGMTPVLIRVPDESADTHFIDREENWEGQVISSLEEVVGLLE